MTCENGFKSLPCAEGFHLGVDFAPAKVRCDVTQRHLFEVQQREQGTVIRREMRKNELRTGESVAGSWDVVSTGDMIKRMRVISRLNEA